MKLLFKTALQNCVSLLTRCALPEKAAAAAAHSISATPTNTHSSPSLVFLPLPNPNHLLPPSPLVISRMEGHAGYNERKLPPLKFSADSNGLPFVPGNDTSHRYAMENASMFMTKAPVENVPCNSALPVHGAFPVHGEVSFSAGSCVEARKSCSSWMQDLNGDNCNAAPLHAKATSSAPGAAWPKRRTSLTDRRRRLRIAERLNALQELLPQSVRGSQASALDDAIDHIKYLQLQIKDLSQTKLRGGSTSEPFIFLEGYGHYISNQEMLNEPLEEMLGKLLEVNPAAAAQLLNGKGLYLMPLDLAQRLC